MSQGEKLTKAPEGEIDNLEALRPGDLVFHLPGCDEPFGLIVCEAPQFQIDYTGEVGCFLVLSPTGQPLFRRLFRRGQRGLRGKDLS